MTAAELRGLSRERLIELILSQQAPAERAAALERTIAEQAAEIDVLRHRIARYERAAFGRSSEKSRGGGDAGDESGGAGGGRSGDDGKKKKKKKKRKGGRPGRRKNRDGAATGKGLHARPAPRSSPSRSCRPRPKACRRTSTRSSAGGSATSSPPSTPGT